MKRLYKASEYILISVILLTAGCASKDAYHDKTPTHDNCTDPSAEQCFKSYYQRYSDYDLAFAEFTERGNSFDSNWIDNVLENIRMRNTENNEQGVVMVVFIHGWKHNAKEDDPNLLHFKQSLASIAANNRRNNGETLRGRRLIGLYVGWRGASIDLPWIENLTFWDRKAVAEEVGKGGVTKLLLKLNQIDKTKPDNVLVVVGHSFGGAIVVSATTEVLTAGVINRSENGDSGTTIGDAVIVLNPAIEADQSLSLVEAAIVNDYPGTQNPLFISISSDADSATHIVFPIGQTLGLLLTWHQLDLKRPYYHDRLSKENLILKEEHLDATAVGNFAPFLTHRLTAESTSEVPNLTLQSCDQVPDQCVPKGLTSLSGHPTIAPLPDNYPLYFIKTDKTVIANHNDVFNPVIRSFMMTIIDDIARRTYSITNKGTVSAPIFSDPRQLNESFHKFYSGDADG
jgi:hypothetical protein